MDIHDRLETIACITLIIGFCVGALALILQGILSDWLFRALMAGALVLMGWHFVAAYCWKAICFVFRRDCRDDDGVHAALTVSFLLGAIGSFLVNYLGDKLFSTTHTVLLAISISVQLGPLAIYAIVKIVCFLRDNF